MLPADEQTCRGKTNDGSLCPWLRPKLRKDQKDDEPAICVNCGHYDTSHPQEAILQQPPTTSSSFGSIMSKYSHLLSKTGASEDIARRETNLGFRKQDLAMPASMSRTAKVGVRSGGSKDVIKKTTAANLRKMGVGSIVMVTVGVNRKGCMKRKVAPDMAKIEELRRLKLAVSKGPDGDNLQIAPGMTKSDIDRYLRTLFPRLFDYLENHDDDGRNNSNLTLAGADGFRWYLIVKSGKNMVKSSQEGLTGSEVLKTRHPAGRKWTDQFIYFGTMLEVDPDSFDDSMNEVAEAEDIGTVGSNDMDESENEVSVLPKEKTLLILKNELDPVVPSCLRLSLILTRILMLNWWKIMAVKVKGPKRRKESATEVHQEKPPFRIGDN
ncbi:hypothetical protein DFJ58DRAFT_729420 [Suillus subalutaceus]|uniref:uncharacterized protein n=1 Tax=Suillus subalutaceus TaxID=48586 RepID=UPI001B87AE87|nr:uncharacterized protein DFJ58DRAFT_729420 [Suillus subalutaceus]KAG1849629.1 hypothetical protein DFJ58DRAFT_729420 [Suillus subalutaceus]